MSGCCARTYPCCDNGYASCLTEAYPLKAYTLIYNTSGYASVPLSPTGYTIYVPRASIVDITFSGTIVAPPDTVPPIISSTYGKAGFQLGLYNTVSGPLSELPVPYPPTGSLNNNQTPALQNQIAVSTTYKWKLCTGTYVVNVYIVSDGTSAQQFGVLNASGQLSIGITRQ